MPFKKIIRVNASLVGESDASSSAMRTSNLIMDVFERWAAIDYSVRAAAVIYTYLTTALARATTAYSFWLSFLMVTSCSLVTGSDPVGRARQPLLSDLCGPPPFLYLIVALNSALERMVDLPLQ